MRDAYSVSKVRAAEAALMAVVPEGALMQRAAAGLASVCAGLLRDIVGGVYGARVVVLAGTGDNGGDALYAAERLARRGAAVIAVQAGERLHEAGARALTAAGGRIIGVEPLRDPDATQVDLERPDDGGRNRYDVGHEVRQAIGYADLIVDGMLGIGGKGGLREPYATLAQLAVNARGATTVAVDLPSGIDADTGTVAGPAVRADLTVTFGAIKPGLLIDPGARHAGVVEFVDIGLGPYLSGAPEASAPQGRDIEAVLPRPTAESDKYRRGVLGLLVGSNRYTGAAVLATGGAVRGGAGMIRLVTFPGSATAVRQLHPEVIITELTEEIEDGFPGDVGRVQAWAVGSGMGTDDAAARRLAAVLATPLPVLVDADGLTLLAKHKGLLPRPAPTLITPHAGELGRLLDADPADIEARRLEYARLAATRLGACVLLKGSTTVIAPPDGLDPVLVNTTGTPWLATAGTGDVLAGLAGSLLAQGLLPPQAAIAAAYLHGLAARLASHDQGGYGGAYPAAHDLGGYGGASPREIRRFAGAIRSRFLRSRPQTAGYGGSSARGYGGSSNPRGLAADSPIGASDVVGALSLAFRAL
jgi:ADP-dependent NAD(P)H-hydrate dehydratase / NAD(P)H-hydrate epimerase